MGLIAPAALGFIALAIPIIIFYMLRLRRQPAKISSLLLWQRVLEDHQANAPWQRLRRNLLLLLQLLILALLVLALGRPFRTVEAKVQGNIILLIDASGSMQATDINPSRLAAAKTEALSVIRTLRPGDMVNLIAVEAVPQPLLVGEAGPDNNALEAAINNIQASNARANWNTAIALAAASANSQANSSVVIISDGAIPADVPSLPAPVTWIPVGSGSDNQAIVALATREGPNGTELFTRLVNFADTPAEVLVEILVDGQLFDARNAALPAFPDGSVGLTFTNLPPNASLIEAQLNHEDDLRLDNAAQTRRRSNSGRVLLVSDSGNLFIERAFSLVPGLTLAQTTSANYPPQETFDLTIFDRTVPQTAPEGNMLFIAPPASTPLFDVQGIFTTTSQIGQPVTDHPLLSFVDFSAVHIAQAQAIQPPAWASVLLDSQGGPLLLAGENDDRRVVIIAFDLLRSDLPLQIDFPILVANLADWLLNQPLTAEDEDATASASGNPLDVTESNIRPGQGEIQGSTPANAAQNQRRGQQEFWWILAALALIVLIWEWRIYWRGGG